jgi:hypothetical protein
MQTSAQGMPSTSCNTRRPEWRQLQQTAIHHNVEEFCTAQQSTQGQQGTSTGSGTELYVAAPLVQLQQQPQPAYSYSNFGLASESPAVYAAQVQQAGRASSPGGSSSSSSASRRSSFEASWSRAAMQELLTLQAIDAELMQLMQVRWEHSTDIMLFVHPVTHDIVGL